MHVSQIAIAGLPLAVQLVSAHGWVNSWVIDGVERDGFVPSDPNRFPVSAERPTDNPKHGWAEPTDPIVACGGLSPGENRETWDINGGSSITVNWISDDRLQPNMVWPAEHRGPVMEYMAECPSESCDGVDAASLQWFKISEAGGSGDQWATDTLNQTRSWTFTIPDNVKPGAYLVRHELVAMHMPGQPQIYPVCIQTNVVSGGNGVPSETVTFPDAYQDFEQDFREIDIWNQGAFSGEFVPPGPRVASLGEGSGSASGAAPSSAAATAAGTGAQNAAPSSSVGSSGGGAAGNAEPSGTVETGVAQAPSQSQAQPTGQDGSGSTGDSGSGEQAGSVTQQPASATNSAAAGSSTPSGNDRGRPGRGGSRSRYRPSGSGSSAGTASPSAAV